MKLDTRNKRCGVCLAVVRAVAMLGVTGLVPVGASADELAGLADPTRPAYTVEAAAGKGPARSMGPELQSTFISATQRRAMISGKSYVIGDKFGGGTIADIQAYEVVVKKADAVTHLRLLPKLAKETHMVKVPTDGQEGGKK